MSDARSDAPRRKDKDQERELQLAHELKQRQRQTKDMAAMRSIVTNGIAIAVIGLAVGVGILFAMFPVDGGAKLQGFKDFLMESREEIDSKPAAWGGRAGCHSEPKTKSPT